MKRFHAIAALPFLVASYGLRAQAPATPPALPPDHMADMHHDKPPAVPSTTLRVDAGAGPAIVFTMDDLKALAQTTLIVHNAHSNKDEMYTGPLLSDVLAKAGLTLGEKNQHQMLDSVVIAAGTDKYYVVYSAAEIQPGLSMAKVIVALQRNGTPLETSGQFQLVANQDAKPARWVHNLSSITVKPISQ